MDRMSVWHQTLLQVFVMLVNHCSVLTEDLFGVTIRVENIQGVDEFRNNVGY